MRRAIAALCMGLFVTAPSIVSAATTTIDLDVAKTQARAYAFGTVIPPHPSERVRVRLFTDTGSGFARTVTRFDTLSSEGRFGVSFPRPTDGTSRPAKAWRSCSRRTRPRVSIWPTH